MRFKISKKITDEFSRCAASETIHVNGTAFIPIHKIEFKIIDSNFAGFGTIESKGIVMVDKDHVAFFTQDENINLETIKKDIPELDNRIQSEQN